MSTRAHLFYMGREAFWWPSYPEKQMGKVSGLEVWRDYNLDGWLFVAGVVEGDDGNRTEQCLAIPPRAVAAIVKEFESEAHRLNYGPRRILPPGQMPNDETMTQGDGLSSGETSR